MKTKGAMQIGAIALPTLSLHVRFATTSSHQFNSLSTTICLGRGTVVLADCIRGSIHRMPMEEVGGHAVLTQLKCDTATPTSFVLSYAFSDLQNFATLPSAGKLSQRCFPIRSSWRTALLPSKHVIVMPGRCSRDATGRLQFLHSATDRQRYIFHESSGALDYLE
jgi:hypothetical protein